MFKFDIIVIESWCYVEAIQTKIYFIQTFIVDNYLIISFNMSEAAACRHTHSCSLCPEDMNIMFVVCVYNPIKHSLSSLPLLHWHTAVFKHTLPSAVLAVHGQSQVST